MRLQTLVAAIVLTACGSSHITDDPAETDTGDAPSPCPASGPIALSVPLDGGAQAVPVTIRNPCEVGAVLQRALIRPPDSLARIVGELPQGIDGGGEVELTVEITPTTTGSFQATLEVWIVDLEPVEIPLTIEVTGPELVADPDTFVFPTVPVGCSTQKLLTLTNRGTERSLVTDIVPSDPALTVESGTRFTLDAEESREVWLRASPSSPLAEGTLQVLGEDRAFLDLPFRAPGSRYEPITETIDVNVPRPATDVLITIDRSVSYPDTLVDLGPELPRVLEAMKDAGLDVHLAAVFTSDDDLCDQEGPRPWMDPSVAADEVVPLWRDMTDHDYRDWPSPDAELGFELGVYALDHVSCWPGWRRAGEELQVIHLSDEDEQSGVLVSDWVDTVTRASAPGLARVHVIGGPTEQCALSAGTDRYDQAARLTGGAIVPICDSPTRIGDALIEALTRRPGGDDIWMFLSQEPVPNTVEIALGGRVLDRSEWSLDPFTYEVTVAEGVTAPPRSTLSATYVPAPDECP